MLKEPMKSSVRQALRPTLGLRRALGKDIYLSQKLGVATGKNKHNRPAVAPQVNDETRSTKDRK
jgi:hypothetical protein